MSFAPRPAVSRYQASARRAAGFRATSLARVAASHAAAPASISSTSIPWRAAGRSPTAERTEVRPPTQSHIGNRSRHPSFRARRSSSLPSWVIAMAWAGNERPAAR